MQPMRSVAGPLDVANAAIAHLESPTHIIGSIPRFQHTIRIPPRYPRTCHHGRRQAMSINSTGLPVLAREAPRRHQRGAARQGRPARRAACGRAGDGARAGQALQVASRCHPRAQRSRWPSSSRAAQPGRCRLRPASSHRRPGRAFEELQSQFGPVQDLERVDRDLGRVTTFPRKLLRSTVRAIVSRARLAVSYRFAPQRRLKVDPDDVPRPHQFQ